MFLLAVEIDARTDSALKVFFEKVGPAKELSAKAKGILIFPDVIKAGFGIGGEYGEGVLRINGKTVDYYNTAAASIGFQLGAQSKTVIIMFLDQQALADFRKSDGLASRGGWIGCPGGMGGRGVHRHDQYQGPHHRVCFRQQRVSCST